MTSGQTTAGTITDRIVKMGLCPVKCAFNKHLCNKDNCDNGVIDSLRQLLHCDNFLKPWSSEYILTRLLTKAF